MINSEPYKQVATHQRLFEYALAYMSAAIDLLAIMVRVQHRQTWPDVAVVNLLAAHSSELFLKGVLLRAGHPFTNTHDLESLRQSVANAGVNVGFHLPATQIADMPAEFLAAMRQVPGAADPSIVSRYPFATTQLEWRRIHHVEPGEYLAQLDEAREAMIHHWGS